MDEPRMLLLPESCPLGRCWPGALSATPRWLRWLCRLCSMGSRLVIWALRARGWPANAARSLRALRFSLAGAGCVCWAKVASSHDSSLSRAVWSTDTRDSLLALATRGGAGGVVRIAETTNFCSIFDVGAKACCTQDGPGGWLSAAPCSGTPARSPASFCADSGVGSCTFKWWTADGARARRSQTQAESLAGASAPQPAGPKNRSTVTTISRDENARLRCTFTASSSARRCAVACGPLCPMSLVKLSLCLLFF
jgi:hypothetical protein